MKFDSEPKNIYAHLPKLEQKIITCLELHRITSKRGDYDKVKASREYWAKQIMHHVKTLHEV